MIDLRRVGPPRRSVRAVLVCLPYAGGGGTVFNGWGSLLPDDVEVRAAVLPGREALLGRPLLQTLPDYVAALDRAVDREVGSCTYALFGHSLGALAAYELAAHRHRAGTSLPLLLVVAGREPPWAAPRRRPVAKLPTPRFLQALARLDGTPRELLANDELVQLMLPALRADFRMSEEHRHRPRPRLPVPVLAVTGADDPEVTAAGAGKWAAATDAGFRVVVLPGGHFFLHTHREQLAAEVTAALRSTRQSDVPPAQPQGLGAPQGDAGDVVG